MDLDEYKKLIMNIYNNEEEIVWTPSISIAKEKMLTKRAANSNKICDISNLKKSEVEKAITGCNLIYCDQFTVKLNGTTAILYERKTKTPNGISCSIDVMVNITKDNRFNTSSWSSFFKGKAGYGLNHDDAIEMCKWLISVKKLSSFI